VSGLIKYVVVAAALMTGCLSFVTGETLAGNNQCGGASWYGPGFNGRTAASGEKFNQNAMTAAHKTLPFGTVVKVVNQKTGKSVQVRINDRGPYHGGRIIDLSKAAATKLGMMQSGTAKVCLTKV
jgi:peptidoglycan lytic transglycosylase